MGDVSGCHGLWCLGFMLHACWVLLHILSDNVIYARPVDGGLCALLHFSILTWPSCSSPRHLLCNLGWTYNHEPFKRSPLSMLIYPGLPKTVGLFGELDGTLQANHWGWGGRWCGRCGLLTWINGCLIGRCGQFMYAAVLVDFLFLRGTCILYLLNLCLCQGYIESCNCIFTFGAACIGFFCTILRGLLSFCMVIYLL